MSILFSGDFHANARGELACITKRALIKNYGQKKFNDIRYHIILGDAGFLWPGNQKNDLYNYNELACRPFPVLCVIGNHEPILGMKDLTETDIGLGETVYQINTDPLVAYFKRGKVYAIDGIKFLVLGGALSIDQCYRIPDRTWWSKEYWTEQEETDIFKLLELENNFDCVISHTGPHHINTRLFGNQMFNEDKFFDNVALLNDQIHSRIQFMEWFCGHWHEDRYFYSEKSKHGYRYLYETTNIMEKKRDNLNVYNETK